MIRFNANPLNRLRELLQQAREIFRDNGATSWHVYSVLFKIVESSDRLLNWCEKLRKENARLRGLMEKQSARAAAAIGEREAYCAALANARSAAIDLSRKYDESRDDYNHLYDTYKNNDAEHMQRCVQLRDEIAVGDRNYARVAALLRKGDKECVALRQECAELRRARDGAFKQLDAMRVYRDRTLQLQTEIDAVAKLVGGRPTSPLVERVKAAADAVRRGFASPTIASLAFRTQQLGRNACAPELSPVMSDRDMVFALSSGIAAATATLKATIPGAATVDDLNELARMAAEELRKGPAVASQREIRVVALLAGALPSNQSRDLYSLESAPQFQGRRYHPRSAPGSHYAAR